MTTTGTSWLGRARAACLRGLVTRVYGPLVFPFEQRLRAVPNPFLRRRLERTTPPEMRPAVEALRRDGIVILPGFVSGERLAACQRSFDRTMDAVRDAPPAPERPMPWRYLGMAYREYEHQVAGCNFGHSFRPFDEDRALLDVALDEFVLGVVGRYFHRRFQLSQANVARQYPEAPRDYSSWMWHHDGLGPRINVMLLLTDVGPADQYMSYLKGTHRRRYGFDILNGRTRFTEADRQRRFAGAEQADCLGRAGTVVVFDSNGAHRGRRSLGATRDTLICSYMPGSVSWPVAVPRRFADTFTPLQRDVFFRNPLARAV
ncbi:MAG: hypothetical protein C0501_28110 [Isosphaera sp.]|nr:hypothetical protein [Isosphaera sp.]